VMTHGQTDKHTDRQTQTDFIICPIAICYSYGADKKKQKTRLANNLASVKPL